MFRRSWRSWSKCTSRGPLQTLKSRFNPTKKTLQLCGSCSWYKSNSKYFIKLTKTIALLSDPELLYWHTHYSLHLVQLFFALIIKANVLSPLFILEDASSLLSKSSCISILNYTLQYFSVSTMTSPLRLFVQACWLMAESQIGPHWGSWHVLSIFPVRATSEDVTADSVVSMTPFAYRMINAPKI